jgi:hypothetical protein
MKKLVTLVAVVCSTLLVAQTGDSLKSKECHKDKKECSSKSLVKKTRSVVRRKMKNAVRKKTKKNVIKKKLQNN